MCTTVCPEVKFNVLWMLSKYLLAIINESAVIYVSSFVLDFCPLCLQLCDAMA